RCVNDITDVNCGRYTCRWGEMGRLSVTMALIAPGFGSRSEIDTATVFFPVAVAGRVEPFPAPAELARPLGCRPVRRCSIAEAAFAGRVIGARVVIRV